MNADTPKPRGRRPGTAKPEQQMQVIGVRMAPDERQQALELAEAEGRTLSNFIRRIYRTGLDTYLAEKEFNDAAIKAAAKVAAAEEAAVSAEIKAQVDVLADPDANPVWP